MTARKRLLTTDEQQLIHIFHGVTWDGDLLSKEARDGLVKRGFVIQALGWNLMTLDGLRYLLEQKLERIKITA